MKRGRRRVTIGKCGGLRLVDDVRLGLGATDGHVAREVGGVVELQEALLDFVGGEYGGSLVALVAVFLVHRAVVFLWVFAAFDEQRHEELELGVGVPRVVHVSGGL